MADEITIDVLGNKAILDNLDKFGVTMQLKAQMLLEEAGDMAKEKADDLAPVGSREYESDGESHPGYLKSQNYVEKQLGVVTVGNDAHYAAPVELGHHTRSGSFVPPQPFLVPSWIDAGEWLKSKLSGLVK